ncbi:Mbeg1-like protein [Propionibacterium sp.]|uniref:Mbeg1-like protein n=1 Tax=Propionibacterium sp. TaxID=1977903 RepID=UPI0039E82F82
MANIRDYLHWRGDLTLAERPFNIVDNVVLSALAYIELDGAVPAPGCGVISVRQAAAWLASHGPGHSRDRLTIVDAGFLDDLANTERFGSALLGDHVDVIDDVAGMQFSALTIQLDDATTYVAFRGTDNTIMGWREDFAMSFQVTSAQAEAVHYLAAVAEHTERPLRVGGHSKGGNLAVYSAMLLPPVHQARLLDVYTNDGPGLSSDIVDRAGLDRIGDRLTKVVPEWALIGALFETDSPTHIVASDAHGLLQHHPLSWQVEGAALSEVSAISRRAAAVNLVIDKWLEDASFEDRKSFTNALFGALSAGGAQLTTEIARIDYGSFESVLVALGHSRTQTKGPALVGLRVAARLIAAVDYRALLRENRTIMSIGFVFLGIFFMAVPSLAVQLVGSCAVFVLAVWGTVRASRFISRFRVVHRIGWWFVIAQALMLGLLFATIPRLDILVMPTNLLLGFAFLAHAWGRMRRAFRALQRRRRQPVRGTMLFLSGIAATLFGIVALTTAGHVLPTFVLQAGAYLVVVGTVEIFVTMRDLAYVV